MFSASYNLIILRQQIQVEPNAFPVSTFILNVWVKFNLFRRKPIVADAVKVRTAELDMIIGKTAHFFAFPRAVLSVLGNYLSDNGEAKLANAYFPHVYGKPNKKLEGFRDKYSKNR